MNLSQSTLRLMARGIYGTRSQPAFALTPLLPGPQIMDMDAPPLQPSPFSPLPHWTDLVPREEMLAVREKFRNVGWCQPNHKPLDDQNRRVGQKSLGQVRDSWLCPSHERY
jgi:hypothetical protein